MPQIILMTFARVGILEQETSVWVFFPNTLLEGKMQNCSTYLSLSLPGGAVSCWGIFQLLSSEEMTKHFAVLMKAKVSDKHTATRLVMNISRNCMCISHFTVLESLFL